MADTTALKNRIRAAIKANDNQEITGPVLQQSLLDIVDELNGATETEAQQRQTGDSTLSGMINSETQRAQGVEQTLSNAINTEKTRAEGVEQTLTQAFRNLRDAGYAFGGIAVTGTNPGVPSGNCFYIVRGAGTYTYFKNADNESIVLENDGIYVLTYESVENNYWEWNLIVGIDSKPKPGSNNLAISGGIFSNIDLIAGAVDCITTNKPFITDDGRGISLPGGGQPNVLVYNWTNWHLIAFVLHEDSDWFVVTGIKAGIFAFCSTGIELNPDMVCPAGYSSEWYHSDFKNKTLNYNIAYQSLTGLKKHQDTLIFVDAQNAENEDVDWSKVRVYQGKNDLSLYSIKNSLRYQHLGEMGPINNYVSTPFLEIDRTKSHLIAMGTRTDNNLAYDPDPATWYYNDGYLYDENFSCIGNLPYVGTNYSSMKSVAIAMEDLPVAAKYVTFGTHVTPAHNGIPIKVGLYGVKPVEGIEEKNITFTWDNNKADFLINKALLAPVVAYYNKKSGNDTNVGCSGFLHLDHTQIVIRRAYGRINDGFDIACYNSSKSFLGVISMKKKPAGHNYDLCVGYEQLPSGTEYIVVPIYIGVPLRILHGIDNVEEAIAKIEAAKTAPIQTQCQVTTIAPIEKRSGYVSEAEVFALSAYDHFIYQVEKGKRYFINTHSPNKDSVIQPIHLVTDITMVDNAYKGGTIQPGPHYVEMADDIIDYVPQVDGYMLVSVNKNLVPDVTRVEYEFPVSKSQVDVTNKGKVSMETLIPISPSLDGETRPGYVSENGTLVNTSAFKHLIFPIHHYRQYKLTSYWKNSTPASPWQIVSALGEGDSYNVVKTGPGYQDTEWMGDRPYYISLAGGQTDCYLVVNMYAGSDESRIKLEEVRTDFTNIGDSVRKLDTLERESVVSRESAIMSHFDRRTGHFYVNNEERDNQSFVYDKYNVEGGKLYTFSSHFTGQTGIHFLVWLDANKKFIAYDDAMGDSGSAHVIIKDRLVRAPENAYYAYLNCGINYVNIKDFNMKSVESLISTKELKDAEERDRYYISEPVALTPIDDIPDYFIGYEGVVLENQNFGHFIFNVEGGKLYTYSEEYGGQTSIRTVYWKDAAGNFIGYTDGVVGPIKHTNLEVIAPANATQMYLNYAKSYKSIFVVNEAGDPISSADIKRRVDSAYPSLMKVVVRMLDRPVGTIFNNADLTTVFYVRTRYNDTKDIILTNYINGNEVLSFKEAFVGPNTLSDDALMSSTYLVSFHTDSTAPFLHARTYWHIYAQHGCPMPRFNNTTSLTSEDVGSLWKDQLDRQFKIGLVTSSYVYLVPVMYQDANGHWVRDWRNTVDDASRPITSLTHVSGATHTQAISTINDLTMVQVRPVMSNFDRKWLVDGKEITEPGTYYCNEFKVNESAIGYAPETITNWFGAIGDNVDLTGAQPLAEFTFSYNFKGAQCCVNTTLKLVREIEANSYGAIQQQFFLDKGDYKAMFLIPKAKAKNGVDLEKPFNSPSTSSPGYGIGRNSDDLKDVNNQVDRQIGYLYNPNTGDYLVGMAAGLSLVSGDTVKEKRNQNIPIGQGFRYLNLNFSPSNTNKFYVSALSSVLFEDHDYYFQPGLFKEINYYVSYFDPAENVGQVYWYKDGSSYVIYCHCQSQLQNQEIKVPSFMEGLSLSIVEKTSDTELLTDTIQNGKFFVNYNSNAANYIVLKAK